MSVSILQPILVHLHLGPSSLLHLPFPPSTSLFVYPPTLFPVPAPCTPTPCFPANSFGSHNPGNNLHVSGLSHKIDTRDLEAAFAKIGRVQKASVMYDPHTRESRGFGFVTMETPEEADAAVAALQGTELGGKLIKVEKARRGRARTPTPGRYYGPPKRGDNERPYDPRPYDSRYARDYDDRGRRGGGRYDDYRGGGRDDYRGGRGGRDDYDRGGRDDYRGGRDSYYDDRDRGDRGGRGGGRGGYDDRRY
ncbi:RRM domain-containing protein [Mycena venus]|uniref:RRM domain-containing protein n=1 Tax=Mycena venus TaxID=2733690 RepID=A0A8H6X7Z8_9AGAR|nr:RRM domain-containing protein [Mycena venus]